SPAPLVVRAFGNLPLQTLMDWGGELLMISHTAIVPAATVVWSGTASPAAAAEGTKMAPINIRNKESNPDIPASRRTHLLRVFLRPIELLQIVDPLSARQT